MGKELTASLNRLQPLEEEELYSWWHTVPGARRFITQVAEAVEKHCALAAHLPKIEQSGFIAMLRDKIQKRHVSLIIEEFAYDDKGDLEDFTAALTERYAPHFLRDFTKDSAMEDLGSQNPFEGYAVIVVMKNKVQWLSEAVTDFNKNTSCILGGSLIFVTCEENPPPCIIRLVDFLTPYDVQFFAINLLETSKLKAQEKLYTATLVSKIAGQSPILTKNLAKQELFINGADFVKKIFPKLDERMFDRAVWECQIQFLLPILEQIRWRLIENNFSRLKFVLPVADEFGTIISDPLDMELRHLHYYGGTYKMFPQADWELLEFAYTARNELSHLKTLDLLQVGKILDIAD